MRSTAQGARLRREEAALKRMDASCASKVPSGVANRHLRSKLFERKETEGQGCGSDMRLSVVAYA